MHSLNSLWKAIINSSQACHLRQPAYGHKRLVVLKQRKINKPTCLSNGKKTHFNLKSWMTDNTDTINAIGGMKRR